MERATMLGNERGRYATFFLLNRIGMILCAALFVIGPAQIGHAQKGPFNNWAGFEATGPQGYNYISAQWTVPTVTFVGSSTSQ
jgi:hypothetical protein